MIDRNFLLALLGMFLLCLPVFVFPAQQEFGGIQDFIVKENLIQNEKLAIIATDSMGIPQESINGTFQFVINGFRQEMTFNEGVGIAPQPVESSAFVFIKHQNHSGSIGKLYYVMKSAKGIKPFLIPWYALILIPLLILLVAYLFKRLLVLALLVLAALFFFNYSRGLNLENLLDTIVHGLKGLIGS